MIKTRLLSAISLFSALALQQVQVPLSCEALQTTQTQNSAPQSQSPQTSSAPVRGNAPCLAWIDENAQPKA
ncbi:MAG: hypothetical protein SFY67_02900, partial [Candidatus Melainabacteria bacterium]|nr:hypothetical protein [Candidatus Melainabacteria bacterium]